MTPKELVSEVNKRARRPIIVVAGCIRKIDKVLLARRNDTLLPEAHGKWEFPGGKVRFGETPREAIQREIKEEVGLSVDVMRLLPHAQSNVYKQEDGSSVHFIILCFECMMNDPSEEPVLDDQSLFEYRWVFKSEVLPIRVCPEHGSLSII